jgi:hypothetical protein
MPDWGSSKPVWGPVRFALGRLVVVLQAVGLLGSALGRLVVVSQVMGLPGLDWSCELTVSISSPRPSWKAVRMFLTRERLT